MPDFVSLSVNATAPPSLRDFTSRPHPLPFGPSSFLLGHVLPSPWIVGLLGFHISCSLGFPSYGSPGFPKIASDGFTLGIHRFLGVFGRPVQLALRFWVASCSWTKGSEYYYFRAKPHVQCRNFITAMLRQTFLANIQISILCFDEDIDRSWKLKKNSSDGPNHFLAPVFHVDGFFWYPNFRNDLFFWVYWWLTEI